MSAADTATPKLLRRKAGGSCVGLDREGVRQERIALALEVIALRALSPSMSDSDRKKAADLLTTIQVIRECDHRDHRK